MAMGFDSLFLPMQPPNLVYHTNYAFTITFQILLSDKNKEDELKEDRKMNN